MTTPVYATCIESAVVKLTAERRQASRRSPLTHTIRANRAGAAAAAPDKVRPCKLLKQSEITTAFGLEASRGSAMGTDCTWQIDGLALSLDVTTRNDTAREERGKTRLKVRAMVSR
jgi:hypothetical protein